MRVNECYRVERSPFKAQHAAGNGTNFTKDTADIIEDGPAPIWYDPIGRLYKHTDTDIHTVEVSV